MALALLGKRPHEQPLRLGARELACLRRWMAATTHERLAAEVLSAAAAATAPPIAPSDRRAALRRYIETTATLRPISAGGSGEVRDATVVDVSGDGIALRLTGPMRSGQSISLQVNPPSAYERGSLPMLGRARDEAPIRILAVVRYCRPDAGSYILGCSFGADWSASLASEILPPDLRALRKSA